MATVLIFLPDRVVQDDKISQGYLFGKSCTSNGIRYVTVSAFLPVPEFKTRQSSLIRSVTSETGLQLIATLSTDESGHKMGKFSRKEITYRLLKRSDGTVSFQEVEDDADYHIALMSPAQLLSSELLVRNTESSDNSFLNNILDAYTFKKPTEDILILFHSPIAVSESQSEVSQQSDSMIRKLVSSTTTGALICFRLRQMRFVKDSLRNNLKRVAVGNILSAVLIDVILGIIFTQYLLWNPNPVSWLNASVTFAEAVVQRLETLLHSLIEMPAGLKLNRPLNSQLGYFFLYHIYLLRTYWSIVTPIYAAIVGSVSLFGFFGFTLILSMACDLFSLATIHIFCFYGYAGRLYSFMAHSLSSLWRLFRGKKWNPLKQRVDSYPYQFDQLFVGSSGFTIILFLLPTVLLYYSVFLVLRLATVLFLSIIRIIISKLTAIPFYALMLKILKSNRLTSGVYFSVEKDCIIRLKVTLIPYNQLMETNATFPGNPLCTDSLNLSEVLSQIVWGDLI